MFYCIPTVQIASKSAFIFCFVIWTAWENSDSSLVLTALDLSIPVLAEICVAAFSHVVQVYDQDGSKIH